MTLNEQILPLVVGAAILDSEVAPQKMLAARRSAPSTLKGLWEFPGGKVEIDEDPLEALLREVREELGVESRILQEVFAPNDSARWILGNGAPFRLFTAVITQGIPRPLEDHDELAWVALNSKELHELEWIPADRPMVDAILEVLKTS